MSQWRIILKFISNKKITIFSSHLDHSCGFLKHFESIDFWSWLIGYALLPPHWYALELQPTLMCLCHTLNIALYQLRRSPSILYTFMIKMNEGIKTNLNIYQLITAINEFQICLRYNIVYSNFCPHFPNRGLLLTWTLIFCHFIAAGSFKLRFINFCPI